jgi:hypothetical protein
MTVLQATTEICSRAGEGFSQYSARAKVLFWKAVGLLVQAGKIKADELRALYNSSIVYVDANGTQPVTLDLSGASGFQTVIAGSYIFDQDFLVFDKTLPQTTIANKIFCSRVSENQFENGEHLLNLSILRKEVLYCIKYPTLKILKNALITSTANVNVEMRYYGIVKATADTDATELNSYLDTGLQNQAIDAAVELLKQEIL